MSQHHDLIQQSTEYRHWLLDVKSKIAGTQIKAALLVNHELIRLYWYLGQQIVSKQTEAKWGSSFIDQFSKDLKSDFPGVGGFSAKNLRYCRAFYQFYNQPSIWQQAVAKLKQQPNSQESNTLFDDTLIESLQLDECVPQLLGRIPWGHHIQLFTKVQSLDEALFYIQNTISSHWSRDFLALQIKSKLYQRDGKAITNFKHTLPEPFSDLAQQTLKDPYVFDFLTLTQPFRERDIENQLVEHITRFLLELGKGFAFMGWQYHLLIAGNDYYLDLLFYHAVLKCYVVIELKNTKFIPEYAGKMNFYLSAVDTLIKRDDDKPTIGILLCREKNSIEVEFALRDMNKPMGVSEFSFTEVLPSELKSSLPTIEEIEREFSNTVGDVDE